MIVLIFGKSGREKGDALYILYFKGAMTNFSRSRISALPRTAALAKLACPLPHDRKSWNTPWTNLVCFLIHTKPDPSSMVSVIGEPLG